MIRWSDEEMAILRSKYPRLEVTAEEMLKDLPGRSIASIYLQCSRLGLSKESLLEHILRRAS